MSFDLCFWSSGEGAPKEIYTDVCEGDDHRLAASQDVLQFRSELLDRWQSFNDFIEPLEFDVETGEPAHLDRYVLVTVPVSLINELPGILRLARDYGLTVYDPQSEQKLDE